MDTTNDTIARLRNWMEQENLDQERLADAVGFSPGAISYILSGKRKVSAGFKLAFVARFGTEAGAEVLGLELAQ